MIYSLFRILPTGKITYHYFTKHPSVSEIQHILGGYFEPIGDMHSDFLLLADEDGLQKGLDPNAIGSQIAGGIVVGPVLVLLFPLE